MMQMQLEREKMQLDLQKFREELKLKYHAVQSTEKIENAKMGDSPERQDQFRNISSALLEAITRKRAGQVKPPGGNSA